MRYKTPKALEMAVGEAAKASVLDTNRAINNFYYHRLLVRVFLEDQPSFVLKGGLGMLARTVDARATRDADLTTSSLDIDAAVRELRRLASKDLGDFVSFQFVGVEPVRADDEYRDGFKVRFDAFLGARRVQTVSVDLVSDSVPCDDPDWLTPADRIEVSGLVECDYPVYPVTRGMADKVCGIMETHNGRPSSRVKDLVDLVVYLVTESFPAVQLRADLRRELAIRHLSLDGGFSVPELWRQGYGRVYGKLAAQTGLPERLRSLEPAEGLVKSCVDPALGDLLGEAVWDNVGLIWTTSR